MTGLWPEGCGIARRAMSFIIPPAAVTSTSSIIIILTLVHPFATSWPSSPKGDARTLRDWLSVSYVTQYPVPHIPRFPLRGNASKRQKGVQGRAPIGCSIAILTANRRPPERSDAQIMFAVHPWERVSRNFRMPFGFLQISFPCPLTSRGRKVGARSSPAHHFSSSIHFSLSHVSRKS